jgi:hypothetical protein
MNVDFTQIKESLAEGYHTAAAKTSEWMGRGIEIFKSGEASVLNALQDKNYAAASVVAVTLLLIEIARILEEKISGVIPQGAAWQNVIRDSVKIAVVASTVGGGVYGFCRYTQLNLDCRYVVLISGLTILIRATFES